MISEALIIGSVNAAIFRENNGYLKAIRLDNNSVVDCSRDIAMLLDSNAEKNYLTTLPSSKKQLTQTLQYYSQRQHALKLVLTGMDNIFSDTTRSTSIQAATQEFNNPQIADFVQARLLGCPLPQIADLDIALSLAEPYPSIKALYAKLKQTKDLIKPINRLLQSLLIYEFEGDYDVDNIIRLFVDHGLVATVVVAVDENDKNKLENLVFDFGNLSELKVLPRLTHFLTLFKSRLIEQFSIQNQSIAAEIQCENHKKSTHEIEHAISIWIKSSQQEAKRKKSKKMAKEALADVEKQKTFILDLLQQGKQERAEKAIVDLVKNQRQSGKLNHLCQSLSDLGTRINSLGQGRFALSLFKYAKLANSNDAYPYIGYAKTLYSLGYFDEALASFQEAKEKFSEDNVFTYTGYAETLRSLGRFNEALAAYQEAKEKFSDDVVTYNGYAETLRSLGHFDVALVAFQEAKDKFSEDNVFTYTGYAATLRSLGRFDEALLAYQESKEKFSEDVVIYNGYAETLRSFGHFDEALSAFQEAKDKFLEDDLFTYTGYAATLRSLGRFDEALLAYQEAKDKFSKNAITYRGYAETLRSSGRFDEALEAYREVKEKFSDDPISYNGYAETLRSLGHFDDTLAAYQEIRKQFPNDRVVKNAMACLFIETGDFEQAKLLLSNQSPPQSNQDWRDYHVLAMLTLYENNMETAEEMFLRGLKNADFVNQKVFKTSLALLLLKQNKPEQAIGQIEFEISNIIAFPESAILYAHGLAKTNRLAQAEKVLTALSHSTSNIVEISGYLKRRYINNVSAIDAIEKQNLEKEIAKLEFSLILRVA